MITQEDLRPVKDRNPAIMVPLRTPQQKGVHVKLGSTLVSVCCYSAIALFVLALALMYFNPGSKKPCPTSWSDCGHPSYWTGPDTL